MIIIDLNEYTFIAQDKKKSAVVYIKKQKDPDKNQFLLNLAFKVIYSELSASESVKVQETDLFKIVYPDMFDLIINDLTNGRIYYIFEVPIESKMNRIKECFKCQ